MSRLARGSAEVATLDDALSDDCWVIGGSEIYRAAMPHADRLVVTEVDLEVDGDAYAPEIPDDFAVASRGDWQMSEIGPSFRIINYLRSR